MCLLNNLNFIEPMILGLNQLTLSLFYSLKKSYDDKVTKELLLINQWRGKADNLDKWLDSMEEHLNNLQLAAEDPSSVRNEFEVILW